MGFFSTRTAKSLEKYESEGYDLGFLSRVAPQGGIKFADRNIRMGDGYVAMLYITDFPVTVHDNWLDRVINRDGIIGLLDVKTIDRNAVLKNVKRSMAEQSSRIQEENSNAISKKSAADSYQALNHIADDIVKYGEVTKAVQVRLYISKQTETELEKELSMVRKDLDAMGYRAFNMQFESKDYYQALFLTPKKQEKRLSVKRSGQQMPSQTLGGAYYFNHTQLTDPAGAYLGQTMTGGPVIFDLFHSDKIRKSFNAIVFGTMGMGKSTFLKMLEEEQFSKGHYIRGFDKSGEFYDMIKQQGGKYIALDGSDGKINMFEVYPTATISAKDLTPSQVGSFQQHISKLEMQFSLLNPELTEDDKNNLRIWLTNFYVDYGLWNHEAEESNNILNLEATEYPVLSDFRKYLQELELEKGASRELKRTKEKVITLINNLVITNGRMFDGHTSIDHIDNEQVVFFNIDGVVNLSGNIASCQLYTALNLFWSQALSNGRRYKEMFENKEINEEEIKRFLIMIDECQNVINGNNKQLVEYITTFQKEMRKFFAGIIFATQSPAEILPEGNDSQVISKLKQIFELTQYKFLLRLDQSVNDKMQETLGNIIKESEYELIPQLSQGQVLLSIQGANNLVFNTRPTQQQLDRFKGGL
ncbi:MAG TPA: ATP-binding protein [Candidatus Dormibacteraeota bacterium]|nr:ATP-binding protein [Candidatus Dormibacteraeota bacterium]